MEVCLELVDPIESLQLSLLIVDDITLILFDVVDCGLDLLSEIHLEDIDVELFLLQGNPFKSLFFLFVDVNFFSGQFRFDTSSKDRR